MALDRPNQSPRGRRLPLQDLAGYDSGDLRADLIASLTVTVLTVPQALAYAMVAGLPPAMGLYAAGVPTLVGSLMRSSRHVITGPSNALSLLVGTVIAGVAGIDPVLAAGTLALAVGVIQLLAGALGLGKLVTWLSRPVVQGYVTGAAALILVGQLPPALGVHDAGSSAGERLVAVLTGAVSVNAASAALGAGSVALLVLLRRLRPALPAPLIVLVLGTSASALLGLPALGVRTIADVAPIPLGLPAPRAVDLDLLRELLGGALACTVLSVAESASVARSLAGHSGQRLDLSAELAGLGLANVAAAVCGGYPASGSLGRSALNLRAGARSRLSGALSGVWVLLVVALAGPVVEHAPVPCLAGLILVVAADLVDVGALRNTVRAGASDAAALVATVAGTWLLRLDMAIALGVAISVFLFLRKAQLLVVRELAVDAAGRVYELHRDSDDRSGLCPAIPVLHLEGSLFFGAAGELLSALDEKAALPGVRALVVRLKRTQLLDATTAGVLAEVGERMQARGQHLILAGMRRDAMRVLERTGVAERIGRDNLFPTQPGWFVAMGHAIDRALELTGEHECGSACPLLRRRAGQAEV